MMSEIQIIKRDGNKDTLDLEKLHKVVFYACENINGVSASEVEIKSSLQFYSGITSSEIQETLIKSAADLISEEQPNYQWVAGRLICYHLRKMVYGQFEPWHVLDLIKTNVEEGFYDSLLLEKYTEQEWDELNSHLKHERDESMTYAAMEQWRGKYLVQNRVTNIIKETPQMAYMLISATLFAEYPRDTRLQWVKDYYDAISLFYISLPTPVMAGVRTPQRQFSSCVLIESDDSLDSINATTSSIVKYVSAKAGIGIGAGSIRALGSPIRKGDAYHTGVIPFYKMFQSATRSCSQGGVRNGAATLYYPIWHYEVEDLLVLKNNKGTDDNRVRHMDYGVQFNKLFYERLISNGEITLFSPSDVPGLYEAFFSDQDKFKELYERAERNTRLRKKTISATELFSMFMEERKNTGRIYLQNVDNANSHSSFLEEVAPIRQSNLCAEIDLPTKPLNDFNDEEGEIALCTLSAINWGKIKKPKEFAKPCELAVRGLDALLTYQDYPVKAAKNATDGRRPLGVGIINLAYWMAKNDMSYTQPDLEMIDTFAEAWSYYLIKASADLAEEQGACLWSDQTKYHNGLTPNQTYKQDVDELVPHKERMPWRELRDQLKANGIRNSTLMALMPAETSAQISNATNGIEPPRSLVSVKQSKHGVLKQVVPRIHKLKNKYELLWDQRSPEGYLKIMAVLQKYIDQGISVNTSYNPVFYEDEKISMSEMLRHLMIFYKYGGKQLYYFNTYDGQGELDVDKLAESTNIVVPEEDITEEDCESCVI
ncbi:MAG: ribonucleoside-diphosphate reductase subunit alpha [Gammaproteobacteria bacterium]|nr:ribonucleoside-diphosphate reductase subunit alpha [Gammaproteobacteria bacterium]